MNPGGGANPGGGTPNEPGSGAPDMAALCAASCVWIWATVSGLAAVRDFLVRCSSTGMPVTSARRRRHAARSSAGIPSIP